MVALAAPFDPVDMDEDHMGDPAPLPHEPRARPQGDRRRGCSKSAPACSSFRALAVERPP